jgi:hypothetical protein
MKYLLLFSLIFSFNAFAQDDLSFLDDLFSVGFKLCKSMDGAKVEVKKLEEALPPSVDGIEISNCAEHTCTINGATNRQIVCIDPTSSKPFVIDPDRGNSKEDDEDDNNEGSKLPVQKE